MIIIEFIKLLLNSIIELSYSDLFFKYSIIYCINFYLFLHYLIYYYIRIKKKPLAGNIIIGGVIVGCIIGEILGLSLVWYRDNIYLPSLEDSLNINTDISTPLEDPEVNATNLKPLTDEELVKKNTQNTIKWFYIVYTVFYILYSIN